MLLLLLIRSAAAEAPILGEVRFEGELPFSASRAERRVGLRPGVSLDQESAQAAAERLRRACILRHYPLASVTWQAAPMESDDGLALTFRVEPGRKGRLRAVTFTGNRAMSDSMLAAPLKIRARHGFWARLAGHDTLLPEWLAADRQTLLEIHSRAGHADAKIGEPQIGWDARIEGYRLTWPILAEGPVYRIGTIGFDADVMLPERALTETLGLGSGDVCDPAAVRSAVLRLMQSYRRLGHAFVEADADIEYDATTARADVLFRIKAGGRPRLRRVRIEGLARTDERIVLREIAVSPGDVFNAEALDRAAVRLSLLPMFSQATLTLEGVADEPLFDVVVQTRERRTGRFEAGYTYGTDQGGAFQVQVLDRNLALLPPFRGQALQGMLGLTWGAHIARYEAGLMNPRIGTSAWDVDGQLFYEDNRYQSDYYRQTSRGGHLLSGRALGRAQRLTFGYEATWIALHDVDEDWREAVGEYDEDVRLTSAVALWRMDRTDVPFRPTRGIRAQADVRAGTRALGGNTDVLRSRVAAGGYLNPFGDHVTSLRCEAVSAHPYGDTERVPAALRLFWGGSDGLRGFESRSVSPLDEQGIPVGGLSGWLAALEHFVPVGSWLDLALYVESGDIGAKAFDFAGDGPVANYGAGLLVRAQNFPVRFDAAVPFNVVDGDKLNEKGKMRFSFSAGYRF